MEKVKFSMGQQKSKTFVLIALSLVVIFALVSPSLSCSKGKKKADLTDYELFTFGEKDMSKEQYEKARDSFKRIVDEYPTSELRKDALLRLADTYYNQEEYEEAKIEYTKYLEMFPASPLSPRAQYYLGMSSFMQIRSPERDQGPTRQALREFQRVLEKYPGNEYAKRAQEKVEICKARLARNSFNIGMFYYRQKEYQSAILRFKELLGKEDNYPFTDKILFYMASSYYESQNYDQAADLYRQMLSSYPNSPLATEAKRKLSSIP